MGPVATIPIGDITTLQGLVEILRPENAESLKAHLTALATMQQDINTKREDAARLNVENLKLASDAQAKLDTHRDQVAAFESHYRTHRDELDSMRDGLVRLQLDLEKREQATVGREKDLDMREKVVQGREEALTHVEAEAAGRLERAKAMEATIAERWRKIQEAAA